MNITRIKQLLAVIAMVGLTLAASADDTRPTKVMLAFDTEDFTCDRSNDAIRDIAAVMTEEGVRGYFNIVGLLAEELVRLRRTDVLDALKPHLIGTQTYGHSLHPTICEVTDLEDYDEAYRNALAMEATGLGMIRAAFGLDHIIAQDPPGNSWSYVSFYVYADLGLKFILGSGFTDHQNERGNAYGAGGIVRRDNIAEGLWMCNLYHVPYSHAFTLEELIPREGRPEPDFKAILNRIAGRDTVTLYMHPHMVIKTQHWDGPNYKRKNHVEWGKWIQVPNRSPAAIAGFYKNFRQFIRAVKADSRFELTDIEALEKSLKPRVTMTPADIPAVRASLNRKFGPITKPASWSVADAFIATCAFLGGASRYIPDKTYGFLDNPVGVTKPTVVKTSELKLAASRINPRKFIPPSIMVGSARIGPADFLMAGLEALETGADSVTIDPRQTQLGTFEEVPSLELLDIKGGWCIHADTFEDKYLSKRMKLQLWTMRFE